MLSQNTEGSPTQNTLRHKHGAWSTKSFTIPDGPSILILRPVDPQHSFQRRSPFALKRELDSIVGNLLQARCISGGSLLIEVRDRDQAETLLQVQTLLSIPIQAEISINYNMTSGKIYSRDLMYLSEEELLDELEEQGVCGVIRMPQGRDRSAPNPMVKLLFRGRAAPTHIMAGYIRVQVDEWLNPPKRCGWCQRYGHVSRHCRRRDPACAYCAGKHPTDSCPREGKEKCAGCGGAHTADSRECQLWKEARKRQGGKDRQPSPPRDPGSWPPLQESSPAQGTRLPPSHGSPQATPRDTGARISRPAQASSRPMAMTMSITSSHLPFDSGFEGRKNSPSPPVAGTDCPVESPVLSTQAGSPTPCSSVVSPTVGSAVESGEHDHRDKSPASGSLASLACSATPESPSSDHTYFTPSTVRKASPKQTRGRRPNRRFK